MRRKKHIVIPDCQVRPGVPTEHLGWIGNYIAEKQPDVVIQLGDFWDMPSLNSHGKTFELEGARYAEDIQAGNGALELLTSKMEAKKYRPKKIILRGNHEARIERFIADNPKLSGAIGYRDFNDKQLGWRSVPFLEPIEVDGILYCHYFCRSANGGVVNRFNGAPSARAQVLREMRSATAGHKQGLDTHIQPTGNRLVRGIIAGSCYLHEEDYLTPQMRAYWRGILVKHEVRDGEYELMEVSLDYLRRRYS